jgi:hypothetical protein
VQRALAREPAERFANALEFTEAIWDDTGAVLRRQRAGQDASVGATQQSGPLVTDLQGNERASSSSSARHANWKAAGIMAIVVAVAATGATLLIVKSPSSEIPRDAGTAVPGASGAAVSGAGARADSTLPSEKSPGQGAADSATDAAATGGRQTTRPLPPAGAGAESRQARPTEGERTPSAPATRSVPQQVRPEPQARVPLPATPRTDSVLASLRAAAHAARGRAVSDGATQADLSLGDSLEDAAAASTAGGRVTDAMTQLVSATSAWADASRAARSRAAQQAPSSESTAAAKRAAAARAITESASTAPSLADQRAAIAEVIESYGRAIEARDMAAIRKVYPGITAAQQRDWQQFFSTVQNVKVSLAIAQLDIAGTTAEARITGAYRYENTSTRRLEEQPVSFRASLQRDASAWRLTAIQ